MKSIIWAALALLSTSVAMSAESPKQAMFLELLNQRLSGYSGDKQAWKRHIAEDCIWVGNGMAVMDKKPVEGMQVDTGARVEIEDLAVRDYGEVAVLTYITVEHIQQGGEIKTQRYRKADTYARPRAPSGTTTSCVLILGVVHGKIQAHVISVAK